MATGFVCEAVPIEIACITCSNSFSYVKEGRGRLRRFCSEACKEIEGRRSKTAVPCATCSSLFRPAYLGKNAPESHGRYCSIACRPQSQRIHPIKPKRIPKTPKPDLSPRECLHCRSIFTPYRPGGAQRAAGFVQVYCSRTCSAASRAAPPPAPKRCATCSEPVPTKLHRYCGPACRPVPKSSQSIAKPTYRCKVCESEFAYVSNGGRPSVTCSEDCERALASAQKVRQKVRERTKGRAVVIENVIPQRVFERDSWRCRACHCNTPQSLRGKMVSNAPELDHIIPLGRGGDHTYANTQLLCRECNMEKGDHAFPWIKGPPNARFL